MKIQIKFTLKKCAFLAWLMIGPGSLFAANNAMVSWNNLGMHCMDSDYSVFSILPPYNTIQAQVIYQGKLVTSGSGFTVTYEAVADPDGSINTSSLGKGNFYSFVEALYGAALAPDQGLIGAQMPGPNNIPRPMNFDANLRWFIAEGIPLTPYDDAQRKNPYPLMRIIARDASNQPVATNDIVLPVSDEMDCRACHASGSKSDATPFNGWVWASNPERDYRLNILRLHDDLRFVTMPEAYPGILTSNGYNAQGLYRSVVADGRPVLCAKCHRSNALPGTGFGDIPPLTQSVHGRHATVRDPDLNLPLNNVSVRAACYRCHPGSTTRCLRGAMGNSVAADGSRAMQCQSCHGSMRTVGSAQREGWLEEPTCQSCHTGTATSNNGQIRYTSCFDTNGLPRVATNLTFATTPNAPAAGLSLYRFSSGHGGLQCSACHNSTHAEYPSSHLNDNQRALSTQGHVGVIAECTACHVSSPATQNGGPHGMHPVGQAWISGHRNAASSLGRAWCANCHGADFRGTELSRAFGDRNFSVEDAGTIHFWRGFQIGCYTCHQGPNNDEWNPNSPPAVANVSTNTGSGQTVSIPLPATDGNGDSLKLRVVTQPAHGAVGLANGIATYTSDLGFVGNDTFTFAANDGSTDSNLGTVTVSVALSGYALLTQTHVPEAYPALWRVPFAAIATLSNLDAAVTFAWDFHDGTPAMTNQYPTHAFMVPGNYSWTMVATAQGSGATMSSTNEGSTVITAPVTLQSESTTNLRLFWTLPAGDALLEWTAAIGLGIPWQVDTNSVDTSSGDYSVTVGSPGGTRFYRVRQL